MRPFLTAISIAATSNYALIAYAICGALFVLSGAKLVTVRNVLREIRQVPEGERRRVIESVTNSVLPEKITADEWIRNNRNRWIYLLCAALVLCGSVIAAVAVFGAGMKPREPAPTVEQARGLAVDFLEKIDAEQYNAAYEMFYPGWKAEVDEAEWLLLSHQVRKPLGGVETRRYMGTNSAKFLLDQPLHGIQLLFYTKFRNLPGPVREVVGLASPGLPDNWRPVAYHVDVPPAMPKQSDEAGK